MGSRRSATSRGPACFHHHDGDPLADEAGDSGEPPWVLDLLQVEQDQVDGGISSPIQEKIIAGDIGAVAD